MANMKNGHTQSYKDVNKTFVKTEYGKVKLALAVGQTNVLTIDAQGIKGSTPIGEVRESGSTLIKACRDAEPEAFEKFCDALDKVNA